MFDDVIEALRAIDWQDVEPEELRDLCENPVFEMLCAYCTSRRLGFEREAFEALLAKLQEKADA